jgi:DNA-binding transcriptional MerR regulator
LRTAEAIRRYPIEALMAEGFSRRCIHYYVVRGILPPASGRGRCAVYDERHIEILREIKKRREVASAAALPDIREWARARFFGRAR